jgi:predicted DNA-binding transcriptional regulator AlpA
MDERWLDAQATARYTGVRIDYLHRFVRAGKLPKPSYHLGPRSPRWDKEELDAAFTGGRAKGGIPLDTERMIEAILNPPPKKTKGGR